MSVGTAMIGVVNRYTYRAEWSPDSGQYVGMCLEFPSRYSRAPTAHDAIMATQIPGIACAENRWTRPQLIGDHRMREYAIRDRARKERMRF